MSDTAFEKEWLVTLRQTKPSEMQPDSVKAPGTPHKSDLRETKELRYGYATKIVEKIGRNAENFRLTTFETSTLLIVPMSCLEVGGLLDSTTKHRAELLWTLRDIANLVGHCKFPPPFPVEMNMLTYTRRTWIKSRQKRQQDIVFRQTGRDGPSTIPIGLIKSATGSRFSA
jgi:hypothetical protein